MAYKITISSEELRFLLTMIPYGKKDTVLLFALRKTEEMYGGFTEMIEEARKANDQTLINMRR